MKNSEILLFLLIISLTVTSLLPTADAGSDSDPNNPITWIFNGETFVTNPINLTYDHTDLITAVTSNSDPDATTTVPFSLGATTENIGLCVAKGGTLETDFCVLDELITCFANSTSPNEVFIDGADLTLGEHTISCQVRPPFDLSTSHEFNFNVEVQHLEWPNANDRQQDGNGNPNGIRYDYERIAGTLNGEELDVECKDPSGFTKHPWDGGNFKVGVTLVECNGELDREIVASTSFIVEIINPDLVNMTWSIPSDMTATKSFDKDLVALIFDPVVSVVDTSSGQPLSVVCTDARSADIDLRGDNFALGEHYINCNAMVDDEIQDTVWFKVTITDGGIPEEPIQVNWEIIFDEGLVNGTDITAWKNTIGPFDLTTVDYTVTATLVGDDSVVYNVSCDHPTLYPEGETDVTCSATDTGNDSPPTLELVVSVEEAIARDWIISSDASESNIFGTSEYSNNYHLILETPLTIPGNPDESGETTFTIGIDQPSIDACGFITVDGATLLTDLELSLLPGDYAIACVSNWNKQVRIVEFNIIVQEVVPVEVNWEITYDAGDVDDDNIIRALMALPIHLVHDKTAVDYTVTATLVGDDSVVYNVSCDDDGLFDEGLTHVECIATGTGNDVPPSIGFNVSVSKAIARDWIISSDASESNIFGTSEYSNNYQLILETPLTIPGNPDESGETTFTIDIDQLIIHNCAFITDDRFTVIPDLELSLLPGDYTIACDSHFNKQIHNVKFNLIVQEVESVDVSDIVHWDIDGTVESWLPITDFENNAAVYPQGSLIHVRSFNIDNDVSVFIDIRAYTEDIKNCELGEIQDEICILTDLITCDSVNEFAQKGDDPLTVNPNGSTVFPVGNNNVECSINSSFSESDHNISFGTQIIGVTDVWWITYKEQTFSLTNFEGIVKDQGESDLTLVDYQVSGYVDHREKEAFDVTCDIFRSSGIPTDFSENGGLFPLGETIVTCSSDHYLGNFVAPSFTIEILESEPAEFVWSFDGDAEVDAGGDPEGTDVTWTPITATFDEHPIEISCDDDGGLLDLTNGGGFFPVGPTVVSCQASYESESSEISFTITVTNPDNADILWEIPTEVIKSQSAIGLTPVTFDPPITVMDLSCDEFDEDSGGECMPLDITVDCSSNTVRQIDTLGGSFPPGEHLVICHAFDVSTLIDTKWLSVTITEDETTDNGEEHVNDNTPSQPVKKGSGGCSDCTPPTFGINKDGIRMVSGGFTYNNALPVDVTAYHTEFPLITVVTDTPNTVNLKVFENNGVQDITAVQFGLGVPEIGSPLSDAETLVEVYLDDTEINEIKIIDSNNLVDVTSATSNVVDCDNSNNSKCLQVTLNYVYRDQPKYNVMAINAIDFHRNTQTNYLNDGILVVGESLNDPLEQNTIASNAKPFYPQRAGIVLLTLVDYKADLWQDKYGFMWSTNEYGRYMVDDIPFPQQPLDVSSEWSGYNDRLHSEFTDYKQSQIDKAIQTMTEKYPNLIQDDVKLIVQKTDEYQADAPCYTGELLLRESCVFDEAIAYEITRAQIIVDNINNLSDRSSENHSKYFKYVD